MREIRVIVANREDENYILPLIANLCAKYTESYEVSVIDNGRKEIIETNCRTEADEDNEPSETVNS